MKNYPSSEELEKWALRVGLKLEPLVPTMEDRLKVLQLLWQYRHLNSEDLTNLPQTDLIVHRVKLKEGVKPFSKPQRRMPAHKEWWMRKLVQDDLNGGVYEYVEDANGRLFSWNAQAVMVDKSFKVHDHLSNPNHAVLFSADLKHAYLIIGIHPEDSHHIGNRSGATYKDASRIHVCVLYLD